MHDEIAPCRKAYAITPHASNNEAVPFRAFYCGGDGHVELVNFDATVVVLNNCKAGAVYPFGGIRVNAIGTTATGLVGISAGDHVRG